FLGQGLDYRLPAAQRIYGRVAGNAQQPGLQPRFGPPVGQGVPSLDEGVLSEVQRVISVAAQATDEGEHPTLVLLHQGAERLALAPLSPADQAFLIILHAIL